MVYKTSDISGQQFQDKQTESTVGLCRLTSAPFQAVWGSSESEKLFPLSNASTYVPTRTPLLLTHRAAVDDSSRWPRTRTLLLACCLQGNNQHAKDWSKHAAGKASSFLPGCQQWWSWPTSQRSDSLLSFCRVTQIPLLM